MSFHNLKISIDKLSYLVLIRRESGCIRLSSAPNSCTDQIRALYASSEICSGEHHDLSIGCHLLFSKAWDSMEMYSHLI